MSAQAENTIIFCTSIELEVKYYWQ